jgi:uncharacterized membrane protein
MNNPFLKDLQELMNANIITEDIARQITEYYRSKETPPSNKFNLVLGILGAILVGSGIILLVAHNWDIFNKFTKTILAFLPLVIAQAICVYAIVRKRESRVWQESSAAFLFCTVPASIAMISQIYHVDGTLSGFLLTWLILTIPLIYLQGSSIVSLLVIGILTWYGVETGYHALFSTSFTHYPYMYAILLLSLLPWYYHLATRNNKSNFFHLHNWCLAISIIVILGAFSGSNDDTTWAFAGYMSLFGLYYSLGNTSYFRDNKLMANPFRLLGLAGILTIAITWTYQSIWTGLRDSYNSQFLSSPLSILTILMLITTGWLIVRNTRGTNNKYDIAAYSAFIFFALLFMPGDNEKFGSFLLNCWVIAIAVYFIRKGSLQNHLGILNFGLLIIALLATFRFFDNSIPFVWRGIFFVAAGVGFFAANYLLLKRRRSLTQNTNA